MFFILSKTLNILVLPLTMVVVFFVLSVIIKKAALEKKIFLDWIYPSSFFLQSLYFKFNHASVGN